MSIEVKPLTGAARLDALPALAELRMKVFHDWPYLYDGDLAYERDYLTKFAATDDAVIIAALDGGTIIGAATGCPLRGHADEFAEPFLSRGYDPDEMFYCGESVLLPTYRGRGIGHAFFDGREAHARALGGFTHVAFCGVVRPHDHPMRPADYAPLDPFWRKRGFEKVEGMIAHLAWKDRGEANETEKPLQFWIKAL